MLHLPLCHIYPEYKGKKAQQTLEELLPRTIKMASAFPDAGAEVGASKGEKTKV